MRIDDSEYLIDCDNIDEDLYSKKDFNNILDEVELIDKNIENNLNSIDYLINKIKTFSILEKDKNNYNIKYYTNKDRRIILYRDPLILWKVVATICNFIVYYFKTIHISSNNIESLLRRIS